MKRKPKPKWRYQLDELLFTLYCLLGGCVIGLMLAFLCTLSPLCLRVAGFFF